MGWVLPSCEGQLAGASEKKLPEYELVFEKLATRWDEAIPLGNATLGALVWENNGKLRISLDRADLWDLRPMANLDFDNYDFKWVHGQWQNNTYENVQQKYDVPYDRLPAPSKIPGGAMEFDITNLGPVKHVKLKLDEALCEVKWEQGTVLRIFVHATEAIGWYEFKDLKENLKPTIVPPPYSSGENEGEKDPVSGQDLRRLGYKEGEVIVKENSITYNQPGWSDFQFQIHTKWDQKTSSVTGSWSISSRENASEDTPTAEDVVNKNSSKGITTSLASHREWWRGFWNRSTIKVPDSVLQQQWFMEKYKLGSAARQGAPPISLQSVWTADNGKLPPWKGDYHHDLNTQLSYWPSYSGNHLDLEEGFLDWLDANKDTFKNYTRDFYGTEGLNVPGVTTLKGEPMGGWIQYSFGPTVGAWLGHHYYLHWRYSMDREFLEQRAYPWISEVAEHFDGLSVLEENGKRKLPLSSSPEVHNNSRDAWFESTTNFDLSLIRWTYEKSAELARELGKEDEAKEWEIKLKDWPDLAIEETGLMIAPDVEYNESHRHFSHLLGYHPLGLLDISNGDRDQEIIKNTLNNLDSVGTAGWTGYSFSWLGNLKARAFDGNGAAETLKIFASSFCLPNSFHVNGDQSGKGYSDFTYRPFTLEGNFAFASGLHEMLLQSHTGVIHLFPAIPDEWQEISFEHLRAEGAFLVSATMQHGTVRQVSISSEKGGFLRLRNPFKTRELAIETNEGEVKPEWENNILTINLSAGQTIRVSKI